MDLWRQKVIENTITDEELKQAVEALRGDRRKAAEAGTARRAAKEKAPQRSIADLLGTLMGKPETPSES